MSRHLMAFFTRGMLALTLLSTGLLASPSQMTSAVQADDGEAAPNDTPPPVDAIAKATEPAQFVFTLEDAGKEASPYGGEEGTDSYGRWMRTRFERDRELGASRLGPNVIETKAWVAKDVNAARALFREQAENKGFPERKEPFDGLNDPVTYDNVAEETAFVAAYWVDNTVWHHYRVVLRKGSNVAVMYLFARRDVVKNPDVMWFAQKLAGRM